MSSEPDDAMLTALEERDRQERAYLQRREDQRRDAIESAAKQVVSQAQMALGCAARLEASEAKTPSRNGRRQFWF